MGKARIIEALGEGQYTIEVVEARERAESAKQQAEGRIASLQSDIADLQGDLAVAQQAVDDAVKDMNAVIEEYQIDISLGVEPFYNLSEYSDKVAIAASERDQIAVQINVAQARIKSDEALIARVNALPSLRQMQAWCADYTDDLSGEVATAEVPGEIGKVIIKPSFAGNAWSASSDGAMQPALASTPAGTFWNLAMMPGWQKWRPTYRTATITSISGDACDISLDAESSSQQGLNVNARSSYSGVPILYMDCNGAAFESGDKVLVAFAGNVNDPVVCGFESEPKSCNTGFATLDNRVPEDLQGFAGEFNDVSRVAEIILSIDYEVGEGTTGRAYVPEIFSDDVGPEDAYVAPIATRGLYGGSYEGSINIEPTQNENEIISSANLNVLINYSGGIELSGGSSSATAVYPINTSVVSTTDINFSDGSSISVKRSGGFDNAQRVYSYTNGLNNNRFRETTSLDLSDKYDTLEVGGIKIDCIELFKSSFSDELSRYGYVLNEKASNYSIMFAVEQAVNRKDLTIILRYGPGTYQGYAEVYVYLRINSDGSVEILD